MKVILRQDVTKLGKEGDIVEVKDGHARNFLLPKGYAYPVTPGNMKKLEEEKKLRSLRAKKELRSAEDLARRLSGASITFVMKAGEEDRLYGSVSAADISAKLSEQGFEIDKKQVMLEEPIKVLGVYTVEVRLHSEVFAKVKVWVVKE
ncbi:MAG: 50S ribosomal protein L9 [Candidatus Glassbacteria bacterium]